MRDLQGENADVVNIAIPSLYTKVLYIKDEQHFKTEYNLIGVLTSAPNKTPFSTDIEK